MSEPLFVMNLIVCRLTVRLLDIEQRLAAQNANKGKDMSEVNKRNIKANMKAVAGKVGGCPLGAAQIPDLT